jgi:hypothetical protein
MIDSIHKKSFWKITLLGVIIICLLTGCGGSPTAPANAAPENVDPNLVYTSGAQTVVAQLTVDAVNNPPATMEPPTPAPLPTLAPLPTTDVNANTNQSPVGGEPLPTAGNAASGNPAAIPTLAPVGTAVSAAPAVAAANTQYKGEWVSQNPIDGSKIGKGSSFTMHWVVKNTGTVTWTKSYMLRFFAGTQMGSNTTVNFPGECAPGKDIDISVRLTAPTATGEYVSNWVLTTPDGRNFYSVNVTINVP